MTPSAPVSPRRGPSDDRFLPVGLRLDGGPDAVTWLNFGSAGFLEPFFTQTVHKLRAAQPPGDEMSTGLDALLAHGRRLPAAAPSGLILHISRCGSTLVSNALRVDSRAVVVSEAPPIADALLSAACAALTPLDEPRTRLVGQVLRSLATIYSNHGGPRRPLVVKFFSWGLLSLRALRRTWPAVPCLVLLRDPLEVAVSQIREPSAWASLKSRPRLLCGLLPWAVSDRTLQRMPSEEYVARVLGQLCACAAESWDPGCNVLNYEDLTPDAVVRAGRLFGLHLSGKRKELDAVFSRYAKDPTGRRIFRPDSERKRSTASPLLRRLVDRWARPQYDRLKSVATPMRGRAAHV